MTEGFGVPVDYSQYASWEQVKAPGGQTYYRVPGTAYLYDSFLSQAKSRPVLWTDPRPQIAERDRLEREAREAASPLNQALPVVGTVGGAVLANHAVDWLSPASAQDKLLGAMAE
jgi:hypothetical protein